MLEGLCCLVVVYVRLDIFYGLLCSIPAELSEPVEQAVCAPEPSAFCCRPAGIRYWKKKWQCDFSPSLVIIDSQGV